MTRLRDGIAVPSKHDQGCDLLYRPRLDKPNNILSYAAIRRIMCLQLSDNDGVAFNGAVPIKRESKDIILFLELVDDSWAS